ncbi:hypothetical protein E1212_20120 [Jiangella ureilytica]|uniref:ATP/GTP-binding protein n=1 Tax=Jiangella ureilytica TaxID=2530374 RepID=A0A4V2XWD0_9ACTN|nr:hypothetical protein [Jiangella ureilytica]TDC48795.1 hypothetical protein E1212_20120 [Jiangella ureilytica]
MALALLSFGPEALLVRERATSCLPGTLWNGAFCEEDGEPPGDIETGCDQGDPALVNVPCEIDGFVFDAGLDRYLMPLAPVSNERYRPPDGDLSYLGYWAGPADQGWMFEWRKLAASWSVGSFAWGDRGLMWLAEGPWEQPVIVVDPEVVAQQILDGMSFEALEVGLAPRPLETDPQSMGLVGAPVWMWVTNAGPTTWGPVQEAATVGGVSVTVTAEVENVTWDMGDGHTVTCAEPGDPYRPSLGVRPSPTCGHSYTQTSAGQPGTAYTVTATANWTATWTASTGAEGTLEPPEPTAVARVRIGERQVIETS